jgi:hypothetical protein
MARFLPVFLLLGACGDTVEEPEPVCVLVREGALPDEEDYDEEEVRTERSMRWEEYVELVVNGRSGQTAESDCTGRRIEWPSSDECGGGGDSRVRPVPLDEESVIESSVSPTERIVWVITHRDAEGEGLGPVARVELVNDRAKVRSLGIHRGRIGRARFREVPLGSGTALIAEGETCANEEFPETCFRSARILPLDGTQYTPGGLRYRNGRCAGPAYVVLQAREEVQLANDWYREFRRTTSVDDTRGFLFVHESIAASDRDPNEPTIPERLVRELNNDRTIRMRRGQLVVSASSHWDALIEICGNTAAPERAENRYELNDEDLQTLRELCSPSERERQARYARQTGGAPQGGTDDNPPSE